MLGNRIEISPDDNETFLVTCPALPELTTFGETRDDAASRASDAVEEAPAARMSDGRDIPPLESAGGNSGGFAFPPVVTSLKVALNRAIEEDGIARAKLQRALRWPRREKVERLFRLDHASRFQQREAAFHALGQLPKINAPTLSSLRAKRSNPGPRRRGPSALPNYAEAAGNGGVAAPGWLRRKSSSQ